MFFNAPALFPRSLIGLIVGITVVPLATLLWLGWRLLEQDRILEAQQAQQRLERAADLVVAALQRALSSSLQHLAAGNQQWPEGTVAVTFREERAEAHPKERVAYLPVAAPLQESPAAPFTQGENLSLEMPTSPGLSVLRRNTSFGARLNIGWLGNLSGSWATYLES